MEYSNRIDLTDFSQKTDTLRAAVSDIVVGQQQNVDLVLTAMLANGHILLEGVPGVAKTLLAKTISALLDTQFRRLQFTPDLMPSDVLGTTIFNLKSQEFDFHPGPVFTQVLLVDEINRAPAKTQAALFEVMEERQVTIDGTTHHMDPLYLILATQNPVELEMSYPAPDDEIEILRRYNEGKDLRDVSQLRAILRATELLEMRSLLPHVVVDQSLLHYITGIVIATRTSPQVELGASPRAGVALLQCAKAHALLQGRDFVVPDDVKAIAPSVLCHRISLTPDAEMNGITAERIVYTLLDTVEIPQS